MQGEVNQLGAAATVVNAIIKEANDLEVRVVLTNRAREQLQLNALYFEFATLMLKVRKRDGTPVHPGPPPTPQVDDGKAGRVNVAPGESVTFDYKGVDYFASPPPPGDYQVCFRYENSVADYGDWTGVIGTDWQDFTIRRIE